MVLWKPINVCIVHFLKDISDKIINDYPVHYCATIWNPWYKKPFRAYSCSSRLRYVLCQSRGLCQAAGISYNGICYHLHYEETMLDWNTARQYCRSEEGRDLAHSYIANTKLLQMINLNDQTVWIGLISSSWIWVEGQSILMTLELFVVSETHL